MAGTDGLAREKTEEIVREDTFLKSFITKRMLYQDNNCQIIGLLNGFKGFFIIFQIKNPELPQIQLDRRTLRDCNTPCNFLWT